MSLLEALKQGVCAHSAESMEAIGRGIAHELFPAGGVLALYGDLGVGKTTLVRGIASAMGINSITSPSFNYYFFYKDSNSASLSKGTRPLLHLDAYRLNAPADFPSLMIDELLTPETLFVIEWPERLGEFLPKDAARLELRIKSEGVHEVKLLI